MENKISALARKDTSQEILRLFEIPQKALENNVLSNVEGRCQGMQRCSLLRQTRECPQCPMGIIGKTKVSARPCRWNVVDSTGPFWAAWEILRLFRILQKPWENMVSRPCRLAQADL